MTAREPRPVLVFGPQLVAGLALLTLAVAVASWFAPLVPVERGVGWQQVQKGLGVNAARSVPSWWAVVLFAVAALGCHAAASWARRAGRGLVAVAWWAVGLGMLWVSVDHALAFHENAAKLAQGVLPEPIASRPVEALLALALAVPAVVLVVTGSRWQRLLIPLAALAYVAGQVVVGAGLVTLALSPHRTSVVEVTLQWAGALLLLLAVAAGREEKAG